MPTVLLDLSILATNTRLHGIGRYASELALGLARAPDGWRVRFLEGFGLDGVRISDDAEAAIARLTAASRPHTHRWAWAYPLRLGGALAARSVEADVLHLPHSGATPLFDTRCARVTTCHDLIPLHFPERYLDWRDGWGPGRRWLDARRFRMADRVIAVSQATADDLRDRLAIRHQRISVVHNGIALDRWNPDRQPDDPARLRELDLQGQRFLLFCGDADWRKNYDGMLAALGVARRRVSDLTLLWAGRLSVERRQLLDREAVRHGVAEAVRFTGFLDEESLKALYRQALATLFVSRAEGFGYPVLEGMAMGCPVITSDRSSMKEIAAGAAQLVDPEDPAAIGNAIVTLAEDEALREDLRRRGLERARRFTLERQARETLEVYRSMLG